MEERAHFYIKLGIIHLIQPRLMMFHWAIAKRGAYGGEKVQNNKLQYIMTVTHGPYRISSVLLVRYDFSVDSSNIHKQDCMLNLIS